MDNPLEQPAPEDPIARVHAFARDLAWGVAHGMWGTEFVVSTTYGGRQWHTFSWADAASAHLSNYLSEKWNSSPPEPDILKSLGLLEEDHNVRADGDQTVLLTQKAFALLEKPAIPPKIFISYRQRESSAFASLIEARLTLADPTVGIFIDKLIEGGAKWLKRIESEVRQCDHFIIVYGPDTPNSDTIPLEIGWAEETDSTIIPVLHHGFTRNSEGYPERFKELNDITVEKESAEAYELAILKLLNALGYPTLQSPRPSSTS